MSSIDFPLQSSGRWDGLSSLKGGTGSGSGREIKVLSRALRASTWHYGLGEGGVRDGGPDPSHHSLRQPATLEDEGPSLIDTSILQRYVKKENVKPESRTRSSLSVTSSDRDRSAHSSDHSLDVTPEISRKTTSDSGKRTTSLTEASKSTATADSPEEEKPPVPLLKSRPTTAYMGMKEAPHGRQSVIEPYSSCYKILEFLFLGGIGASLNNQLLCKLKIEYLINVSGMDPQDLPPDMKSSCPCLCNLPTAHSRVSMALEISDSTPPDAVVKCFSEVNRFVAGARTNQKRVLIFRRLNSLTDITNFERRKYLGNTGNIGTDCSKDGMSRAPALVIQYVMSYYHIPCSKAKTFLSNSCPTIRLSDNLEKALVLWEKSLDEAKWRESEEEREAARRNRPASVVAWNAPK